MIIIKDSNEIIGAIQARADVLVVRDKCGDYCIEKNRFGKTGCKFKDLTSVGKFLHQELNEETNDDEVSKDHEEEKASALFISNNDNLVKQLEELLLV